MQIVNGVFLVLVGVASMGFGLFLFYGILPLFYAMFGIGVGYWLGAILTETPPGEMSFIKFLFAVGGGVLFAGCAHYLEQFRRTLIGIGLGSLVGALIAGTFGWTGTTGVVVMIVGAVVGAGFTLAVFDTFVVVVSAFGGAGLTMDGLHLLLPFADVLDRTAIADRTWVPLLVWVAVGALSTGWQFANLQRWAGRRRRKHP